MLALAGLCSIGFAASGFDTAATGFAGPAKRLAVAGIDFQIDFAKQLVAVATGFAGLTTRLVAAGIYYPIGFAYRSAHPSFAACMLRNQKYLAGLSRPCCSSCRA